MVEEYNCDWEPKYELWQVDSGIGLNVQTTQNNPTSGILPSVFSALGTTSQDRNNNDNFAPYISTVSLSKANFVTSNSLRDTTYLILPRGLTIVELGEVIPIQFSEIE